MIDAGGPKFTQYYGAAVGKDISAYSRVGYDHAEGTFKFIMAGNCNSTGCLKPVCQDMVVDWCMFWDYKHPKSERLINRLYMGCLKRAAKGNYDIVNMSLSGTGYDGAEKQYLDKIALRSIIVVAAGNSGVNRREYPSAYSTTVNGPIVAISAVDSDGVRLPSSNKDKLTVDFLGVSQYYNSDWGYWKQTQGTSIAAALYTNYLVKEMCPSRQRINHGKAF